MFAFFRLFNFTLTAQIPEMLNQMLSHISLCPHNLSPAQKPSFLLPTLWQWSLGRLRLRSERHSGPNRIQVAVQPIVYLYLTLVLQWVNASHLSCHHCIRFTLTTLKHHFWWPTMDAATREFVSACSICAKTKTSHCQPSGL